MRARGRRRVDHIRLDLTLGVGGAQLRGRRPPCVMSAARARECERGTARAPARRARTRFEESCRQSSRTELELRSHALNSIETACTYMKRRGFSLRETEKRSSFTGRWPCGSNRDLRDRCTCGRVEPQPRLDRRRASVALIQACRVVRPICSSRFESKPLGKSCVKDFGQVLVGQGRE